jgi:thiol-disulfide isomerase/thioredoxin
MKLLSTILFALAILCFLRLEAEEEVKAPELVGIEEWLNSPPLSLQQLHGRVVLIDFWAYSCINCIRTFPYLEKWYKKYKDAGFVIIGVHSPEFEFEKVKENVQNALVRFKITYPIAMDNHLKTWNAYHNRFWPAEYLIDQNGIIRKVHFGEGHYEEMENAIRALLRLPAQAPSSVQRQPRALSQETYLGFGRAEHYAKGFSLHADKSYNYSFPKALNEDEVALQGPWKVEESRITATGPKASIELNFLACNLYLVLSGKSSEPICVRLDGQAVPKAYYSDDMSKTGAIFIDGARKYSIVRVPYGWHKVQLFIPEGISLYTFTFGDE